MTFQHSLLSHSEADLVCLTVSRHGESNSNLISIFDETTLKPDWDLIDAAGGLQLAQLPDDKEFGAFCHTELTVGADKKAVEALRGSGPCCPWCACGRALQHLLPWAHDEPPPRTFIEFVARCRKVCGGLLTNREVQLLALGATCEVCQRVPYPTEAKKQAAQDRLARLAASNLEKDVKEHDKARREFAQNHGGQREFAVPALDIDMDRVIPELLHLDQLNTAKIIFKHLGLRHADKHGRTLLTAFFRGVRRPIDLRKKEDGRHRADKWWRGSIWEGMVQGSDSLPGGIAAWLPTMCLIIIRAHREARERAGDDTSRLPTEVRELVSKDASTASSGSTAAHSSSRTQALGADGLVGGDIRWTLGQTTTNAIQTGAPTTRRIPSDRS